MQKPKKGLVFYQTMTGNTEKVALRFKKVFEDKGWACDLFKVGKDMKPEDLTFDFQDYDFLCVGSGVYAALPGKEVVDIIFTITHQTKREGKVIPVHRRIKPGPKKGIVFVTFAGTHLGPKEAEPALSLLDLTMEHLRFKCVGRFHCPGGVGNKPTPGQWYGDIRDRPNERDLRKSEIFLEEKLEEPS